MDTSPAAVKAAVALAKSASTTDKARGLIQLVKMSYAREVEGRLFETPGLVDVLVKAGASGETNEIKENGLVGLVNLAIAQENKVRLFDTSGVVQAMLKAATSGETNEIKENGLLGLSYLASAKENKARLFDRSGVVDVMVKAGTSGETSEIKDIGLRGLASLLYGSQENQVRLFDTRGAVEAMLNAATSGETINIKDSALLGLANLSVVPVNQVRMFSTPGIVPAMLRAATKGETDDIRKRGLKGLWSITESAQVADALVEDYNLLSVLLGIGQNKFVPFIMLNLVVSPKTRSLMSRDSLVIDCLAGLSKSGNGQVSLYSKLALAILTGSHGTESPFLKTGNDTLEEVLKILDGALTNKRVQGNDWTLNHPLLALRYLTTVDENRKALGTKWLSQVPVAIDLSLQRNDAPAAESAVACLLQYAFDDDTLKILQASPAFAASAERIVTGKLTAPEWGGAVNTAQSLLFKLEGRDQVIQTTPVIKNKVMISYSWGPSSREQKTGCGV